MKCEKCGKEIRKLLLDMFDPFGSDSPVEHEFHEVPEHGYVGISTTPSWVGYELSSEEMLDTVECPHCHKFPFDNTDIQLDTRIDLGFWVNKEKQGSEIRPDDDFESVLICALRYSIGRQTYMPHIVSQYIQYRLHTFSDKALCVMERDITEAGSTTGYGDDKIDKPAWIRLLFDIRDEQQRRKEAGGG